MPPILEALLAVLRALSIIVALALFLCVGVPAQWMSVRLRLSGGARAPVWLCRALIWLMGVDVSVIGAPASSGAQLLVANHISWIDILALTSVAPFSFLAKREVGGWPLVGALARLQGTVFVDRTRRRSIPPANAAMARLMAQGRSVLIFPEGTTGDGLALRAFGSSHFACARDFLRLAGEQGVGEKALIDDVAVLPVAISYSSSSAAWLGDASLLPHVWRVLSGGKLRCRIHFGEALRYARGSNRKIIAREAAERVALMLADASSAPPLHRSTDDLLGADGQSIKRQAAPADAR